MSDLDIGPRVRSASPADEADRAVLERVAAGDLDALDMLYDRYRVLAYSIALRITADASLAEDVVQDAFLGAWRNAGRYAEARASVKTWLLAIVHHRAVDAVRRRRPTTELPEREDAPPPQLTLPDIWSDVSARLDQEAVQRALHALSDVQREALELAYFGGLTQQEIAQRTATPLGTVKSRMRLGLLTMRRFLSGEGVAARRTGPGRGSDVTAMTCEEVLEMGPAFVLGALERDEERTVAEHVRTCPHGEQELAAFAEFGAVIPALLESVPLVEPPASLRGRIRAAASRDLEERRAAEAALACGCTARRATARRAARLATRRDRRPMAGGRRGRATPPGGVSRLDRQPATASLLR